MHAETGGRRGTALVTGGRRGIGGACAVALAEAGYDVAIIDTVHDAAAEATLQAVRAAGGREHFITGDISALAEHAGWIESCAAQLGPITCLVDNAGVNVPVRGDMLATDAAVFDQVFSVNVRGTFFLTQAVARHMLAHGGDGLRRSIVVVSSANAQMVSPEKAAYCLSKSALPMLARLFAARLAADGIDVFEVQPGLIQTEMNRGVWDTYGAAIAEGASLTRRWGQPGDVARVVATLACGLLPFCTGTTLPVGGGLHVHRL